MIFLQLYCWVCTLLLHHLFTFGIVDWLRFYKMSSCIVFSRTTTTLSMRASPCSVGPMTHLSHAHVCNQHCQHGGIPEGHDWPCRFWHIHWARGMEMSQQPEWKWLPASKLLMLHGYTLCKHQYTHSKAHYAKATCYSACSHRDGKVTCVVGLLARWNRQLHGPILGWYQMGWPNIDMKGVQLICVFSPVSVCWLVGRFG